MPFEVVPKGMNEKKFRDLIGQLGKIKYYDLSTTELLNDAHQEGMKLERAYLKAKDYDNLISLYSQLASILRESSRKSGIREATAEKHRQDAEYWSNKVKIYALRHSVDRQDLQKKIKKEFQNKNFDKALDYLNESFIFGLGKKWNEVQCPDGTKVIVLKNPNDALRIYAGEWNSSFEAIETLLQKMKDEKEYDKIRELILNLGEIEQILRERYEQVYTMFIANPCDKKNQEVKRFMDKAIIATRINLENIQKLIENNRAIDLLAINNEILKIREMVTKRSL